MPNELTPEFWDEEKRQLLAVLGPTIERLVRLGIDLAGWRLQSIGLGFNQLLAHRQGMDWAQSYTDQLLDLLGTTTQAGVGDQIAAWLKEPGATRADLVSSLSGFLDGNLVRMNSVAVTETTRATAQGSIIGYTQAGAVPPPMFVGPDGIARPFSPPGHPQCRCDPAFVRYKDQWLIVWLTNRDSLVCKRVVKTPWGDVAGCRALHGVCISDGEYLGRKIV